MTLWLYHPAYIPARERLIDYLRTKKYRFRRLQKVVFLCGGAGRPARGHLRDYFEKRLPDVRFFYAERVWEHIASRPGLGALKMEAELAELADLVIIVVESPGTFAELGAFSLSDPLRKKLLPLVDKIYEGEESFLSTGPLRWIDSDSAFAPTIFVPLGRVLEAVEEIDDRIARIDKPKPARVSDLALSPKHLLFFICDLVAVIYPATSEMVKQYLGSIAPSILSSPIDISTLLGLGVAMNLLQSQSVTVGGVEDIFYAPATTNALERPFHHRRLLDLPTQRADHVSVLLTIPAAVEILAQFRS